MLREISLQDIQGFCIGSGEDATGGTGCTVLICPDGAPCGLDVRGGRMRNIDETILTNKSLPKS